MEYLCSNFLLLLLIGPLTLAGQTTGFGEEKLGPYQGVVEFKPGDDAESGYYSFSATSNEDSVLRGMQAEGFYVKGFLNGQWKLRFSAYEAENRPHISEYRIELPANGSSVKLQASFQNNKAEGRWLLEHEEVVNGAFADSLKAFRVSFDKGRPVHSFSAWWPDASVQGQFDANHRLDGTWVLRIGQGENEHIERRTYENGRLLRLQIEGLDGEVGLLFEQTLGLSAGVGIDDDSLLQALPIDENVLSAQVLAAQSPVHEAGSTWQEGSRKLNQRLLEVFQSFVQPDGWMLWDALSNDCSVEAPILLLREFPYAKGEKEGLKASRRNMDEALAAARKHFDDPLFKVTRVADADQAKDAALLELLALKVRQVNDFVKWCEAPAMRWVNREVVLVNNLPQVRFPDEVHYTFQQEERSELIDLPDLEADNLQAFLEQAAQLTERCLATASMVGKRIASYRNESQLAEREEELIALKDSVLGLFGGRLKPKQHNTWHVRYQAQVERAANSTLESFFAMPLDERKEYLDSTMACLRTLRDFHFVCVQVPQRLRNIDEAYSRTVWNPYTYTDMTERVKERVYRAYEQVILPAIAAQFDKQINCATLAEDMSDFQVLYRRMLDLREVDTKELEKQLRRKTDVTELIELLNLNLTIR